MRRDRKPPPRIDLKTASIDELREADRVSRRRPLGSGYQIVIIEDVELTTKAGGRLA